MIDGITPIKDEWELFGRLLEHPATRTAYVWGPPGIGKTYVACRQGLDGRELYIITLTPETPAAELRGFWMPQGLEFVWQDGVFIKAMREGARIVINEVSHASHDVLAILYPILESPDTAALTLPTTETVRPAKGFQVVCTDNESPDNLPAALQDRFKVVLHVKRPHPNALKLLSPEFRRVMNRTNDVEQERRVGLRGLLTVQELEKELGTETALRAVFGGEQGDLIFRSMLLAKS